MYMHSQETVELLGSKYIVYLCQFHSATGPLGHSLLETTNFYRGVDHADSGDHQAICNVQNMLKNG